ncbi:hypothetical protein OSCI_3400042 [Kamptonema sp. PCC 6506]|nr:hypothetical protein OSCI_3400042 [Kamptonema sp. PCC 6506]
MLRKIRDLKGQIAREGFVYLPKRGKGSHERLLTELNELREGEGL